MFSHTGHTRKAYTRNDPTGGKTKPGEESDISDFLVWHGGFYPPILHCFTINLATSRNNGRPTSLWNFVPNSGLDTVLPRHVDRRNGRWTELS